MRCVAARVLRNLRSFSGKPISNSETSQGNRSTQDRLPELRIGVTGHRIPPKLPAASIAPIRRTVARLLKAVAQAAHALPPGHATGAREGGDRPGPVRTVIVSSLAEGADQLVAEEGLALGSELDAVIPFAADEYKRDFTGPQTGARFDALMQRARSGTTLGFGRDAETRAYEAAGNAMLEASDILIAIWDENPADGRGGTAHVVEDALASGKPVLLINPGTPGDAAIMYSGSRVAPSGGHLTMADATRYPENRLSEVLETALAARIGAGSS